MMTEGPLKGLFAKKDKLADLKSEYAALKVQLLQQRKNKTDRLQGKEALIIEQKLRELYQKIRPHIIFNQEWNKSEPTPQVRALVEDLRNLGIDDGTIVDVGAGLGRNSIFLADLGFNIKAIERDAESAFELEARAHDRLDGEVADKAYLGEIEVINDDMRAALKQMPSESATAIVDSGASHYLGFPEAGNLILADFIDEVRRVLKPGGLYVLLHFSEDEKTNPELAGDLSSRKSNLSYAYKLIDDDYSKDKQPPDYYELVRPWQKISWKNDLGQEHSAWIVTARKPKQTDVFTNKSYRPGPVREPLREKTEDQLPKERVRQILNSVWEAMQSFFEQRALEGPVEKQELLQTIYSHPEVINRKNNPVVQIWVKEITKYIEGKNDIGQMTKVEFLNESYKILKI